MGFGRLLCSFKLHTWAFVAHSDYGRGRLEKCVREGCVARRRVPITLDEIQDILDGEREKTQKRPIYDAAGDAMIDALLELTEPSAFTVKVYCARCRCPVRTGQKRCPNPSCRRTKR